MDHPTFRVRCSECHRLLYSLHEMTRHCSTHCLSSVPPTAVVLPHSVSAFQPTQTLSASLPPPTVANHDTVSSNQSGTDASPSSAGVILPQAASTQHHSIVPPDGSAGMVARPTYWATYLLRENRQIRKQNSDYKPLLRWCLHHLQSFQTPPPSAGDEVDMALRRVAQQTTVMPPHVDENSSFEDVVSKLYDFYVGTD